MAPQPRHRPQRRFPKAERKIVECEQDICIPCGETLRPRKAWHMRKTVQMLKGPVFVAGRSKECVNPACAHLGLHYYASGVLLLSLPHSTYGLDVLAFIGWQHEHEHRQLVEIQRDLNQRGVVVNERNVGKLYRQFLALLGAMSEKTRQQLAATAGQHGGVIWAIDALQPEGHGTLLYVLYEVLSGTPVSGLQADHPTADQLREWLKPYQALPHAVLATLSDGEDVIIAAMKGSWPNSPHQRCQEHFLGNLAEPVLAVDTQLRQHLRDSLGGLPAVPEQPEAPAVPVSAGQLPAQTAPAAAVISEVPTTPAKNGPSAAAPLFCLPACQ